MQDIIHILKTELLALPETKYEHIFNTFHNKEKQFFQENDVLPLSIVEGKRFTSKIKKVIIDGEEIKFAAADEVSCKILGIYNEMLDRNRKEIEDLHALERRCFQQKEEYKKKYEAITNLSFWGKVIFLFTKKL